MDFELRAAKEKWEREQKQRKDQARARLERERKAKEEALKQREALEAEQRQRRVEEAEAAAAARQQEESDLFAGDGVRFNVVLQAVLIPGDGDKIRLPTSSFEHLSSQGALEKGPMFFEITVIENTPAPSNGFYLPDTSQSKATHAGVLQFTALDGYAELPIHVWRNLGLSESQELPGGSHFVRVRYVRLPKCTYAKLQSEASDFADVPNHKAVLETKLRQHATLSQDDFLTVQYGATSYNLRVLELKPAANVSVLETDMEVDVIEASSTSSQVRLVPLELGKPQEGVVKEGCYNYYKLTIEQKILDEASRGERDLSICLEIKGESSGDADLYVAAHPVLFPTQHQHQWSSHDLGTKLVDLTGGGKAMESRSYSIGVFGFRGVAPYKIWAQSLPSQQHTSGQKVGSIVRQQGTGTIEEGLELCGNCRQAIPSKTIALHEAYCRRHNVVCNFPSCGVVLRKEDFTKHVHCLKCGQSLHSEELEKHLKVFHEPQFCKCGAVLEREAMVNHQANGCPLRMITCKFCGDMVQAGTEAENVRDKLHGLTQHESICGARTAPCDSCGRAVMLKEMDLHRAAAHTAVSRTSTSPTRLAPFTVRNEGTHPEGMAEHSEPFAAVHCPICSVKFEGLTAEGQLNAHLDSHFYVDSRSQMNATTVPVPPLSDSSHRSSLSVACPICGLAVHSERDLSSHMDMVH